MSSCPWFDTWLAFGCDWFEGMAVPPTVAAMCAEGDVPDGDEEEGWTPPLPLPPIPPGAPGCALDYYAAVASGVGNAVVSARNNCFPTPRKWRWERLFDEPIPSRLVIAPASPGFPPNWGDPCSSFLRPPHADCPFLDTLFRGWDVPADCAGSEDASLTDEVSPGYHRLVRELITPSGRWWAWWPGFEFGLVVRLFVALPSGGGDDLPDEERECFAYKLGLALQLLAFQSAVENVQDELVWLKVVPYNDGILVGREIVVSTEASVETFRVGVNPVLSVAFCGVPVSGLFAPDVGFSLCAEDDMGCSCEDVQAIVDTAIGGVNDRLDAIDSELSALKSRFDDFWENDWQPARQLFRDFFSGKAVESSWLSFRAYFNQLRAYVIGSSQGDIPSDPDTVILPALTQRIDDAKTLERLRFLRVADWLRGIGGAWEIWAVDVTVTGERSQSRDTYIQGATTGRWGYNHYGQVRLAYFAAPGQEVRTEWRWVRARNQRIIWVLPPYLDAREGCKAWDSPLGGGARPTPVVEYQCQPGSIQFAVALERLCSMPALDVRGVLEDDDIRDGEPPPSGGDGGSGG